MTSPRPHVRAPLNPDAARFLDQFGGALAFPSDAARDSEVRDRYLAAERSRLSDTPGVGLLTPAERAITTEDHGLIDGVWVRSYVPVGSAAEDRPVAVLLHGGGWVSGSVDLYDTTCRLLADAGDLVVFSVGYRLAPEHPFPTPLDDADRALQWVRSVTRERFSADPTRLALVGTSAGGNLAAALALRIRDRGIDELALQVLLYPALDGLASSDSYAPDVNGRDYFITAEHMRWYWEQYRGGRVDVDTDPYFSPMAARDLAGVAPAIIVSAEYDVLRDDAHHYHQRLCEAGVRSELLHYPQIHGFLAFLDVIADAAPTVRELGSTIRAHLDATSQEKRGSLIRPAIEVTSRIEPGTLERLDALTRWDSTSIETIRGAYEALPRRHSAPADGVQREDALIRGGDGRPDVRVRWYRPSDMKGPLAGVVYVHGGAYIMGTLDENDDRLDQLVLELGVAVVSIDYRLAPGHPYPAGLDDVETVWRAITAAPEEHGVDGTRLAIAGSSAGAGLATAMCMRLRQAGLRQPRLQLLIYPMLDDREWPSMSALAGGAGHWGLWHLRSERHAWAAYLGQAASAPPVTAVPGRARPADVAGLAPAYIGVGDVDALVDSNLRYAATLIEGGVRTELSVYPGVIHGGWGPRPQTPQTRHFLRDSYDALERALARPSDGQSAPE